MRSLQIKRSAREAKSVLQNGFRLIARAPAATLLLGLVLALLPELLRAYVLSGQYRPLMETWSRWAGSAVRGHMQPNTLALLQGTLQQTGMQGIGQALIDLLTSFLFSPLLLSSLALLFNGYAAGSGIHAGIDAARKAFQNVRNLIIVALACMLAEWFVQMVPSVASGLLSLLAEMLGWIPLLGAVARVLAILLSVLISVLTDFAVVVIFCYVWICATCEGVSGFGALVRSWQLTRNAMRETIASLLALTLLRWALVLVIIGVWLLLGGTSAVTMLCFYLIFAVGALYTVGMGAVTSALYQRRPVPGGPSPGQFRSDGPDLENMKRANL